MSAKADMPTCCMPLFRKRCNAPGVECKITANTDPKKAATDTIAAGEAKNQPGWENIPLEGSKQPVEVSAANKDAPAVPTSTTPTTEDTKTIYSETQKPVEQTVDTSKAAPETAATTTPFSDAAPEAEIIIDLDQEATPAPVSTAEEPTGEVMVSLDNWARQTVAAAGASKIPHCPPNMSPTTSQELTIVLDSSTAHPKDSPRELQTVMQNLLPALAPNAPGSPNSPITIVNISVNHYGPNYKLQPDGTWAAPEEPPRPTSGFGRAGSAKTRPGPSPKVDPVTGKPGFNRNTKTPGNFGPAPAVPKRLGSAPKKLAITES